MRHTHIPFPPVPSLLRGVPANIIADTIERLIAELDLRQGDPEAEANGDEEDGSFAEDDFANHTADGPGCPLSDPDLAVDDTGCDPGSEDGF